MSASPATRRYADWMPSSTALISCSRETCFSALSWRRAPTKSRLTAPPRCCFQFPGADKKKRGGHPRHGAAVQFCGSIHGRAWTVDPGVLREGVPDRGFPAGGVGDSRRANARTLRADRGSVRRIAPVDVGLEDV